MTDLDLTGAVWRKSARSSGQGGQCVEAALLFADLTWRKSARSNGATACVQATTDGAVVAVQNSNLPHPAGAALTVSALDWLAFLDHVAAGRTDRDQLTAAPTAYGPFTLAIAADGWIELRCAGESHSPTVRYTHAEWDVFTTGAAQDGEFTLDWLLAAQTPVS